MNAWTKGWNKRAKWSLVFVVAWAVFDASRFYATQGPIGYYPAIIIFMAIPINRSRRLLCCAKDWQIHLLP
jgi:hypothetical protein